MSRVAVVAFCRPMQEFDSGSPAPAPPTANGVMGCKQGGGAAGQADGAYSVASVPGLPFGQ